MGTTIKEETPFSEDGNTVYFINGGRCAGKVNKVVQELVDYTNKLLDDRKKLREWLEEQKEDRYYANDVYRHTAYDAVLKKMDEIEKEKDK